MAAESSTLPRGLAVAPCLPRVNLDTPGTNRSAFHHPSLQLDFVIDSKEHTTMSITLTDQDKLTLGAVAHGAVSLMTAAGARLGSPIDVQHGASEEVPC